jgi:hypothetical protein
MNKWAVEEISRRKLNAFIDENFLYVGVRFSLSQKAQELGAKWCIYQRKWRILAEAPQALSLLELAGWTVNPFSYTKTPIFYLAPA